MKNFVVEVIRCKYCVFATWVKVRNSNRFWKKKLGVFIKTAPCNQKTDTCH